MSTVSASAPGKLLLAGEYAVLRGAPAIAMAVSRRATVQVDAEDGSDCIVRSTRNAAASFRSEDDGLRFLSGGEAYRLFECAWAATAPRLTNARNFLLDTEAFMDPATGLKLGVGSSAALTVALCAALLRSDADQTDVAHAAQQAHQALQGGKGSGVDVASACFGGVIEYRMEGMQVSSAGWPEGLEFAVLWSGVPVRTEEKLARYANTPGDDAELVAAAERVAQTWQRQVAADLVGAVSEYVVELERFSSDHGLGVFDAGHAALARRAASFGVTYKPCGAGGGDVGVALGTERDAVQAFAEAAAAEGFARVKLEVDWRGVVREGAAA